MPIARWMARCAGWGFYTNFTAEGETTAHALSRAARIGLTLTRMARGLLRWAGELAHTDLWHRWRRRYFERRGVGGAVCQTCLA